MRISEGEVQIVQLANSDAEAKWIAKKVKELLDKGAQPHDIIILVQRKRAARVIRARVGEQEHPWATTFALALAEALAPAANDNDAQPSQP